MTTESVSTTSSPRPPTPRWSSTAAEERSTLTRWPSKNIVAEIGEATKALSAETTGAMPDVP